MKHSKTLIAAAVGLLVVSAMPAHAGDKKVLNYVKSSDGTVVRDSNKDCVRSSDKTSVMLEECGYKKEVVVTKEPEKVEVAVVESGTVLVNVVVENIQFAFDSAELSASSKATLDDAVAKLSPYKDTIQDQTTGVTVTGYTDTSGPEDYNMKLSQQRAESVTNYLITQGINQGRFTTKWYGELQPKADNSTSEGKRKNRRVELIPAIKQ